MRLYTGAVCTGSWLWEKNPLPHWGLKTVSVLCLHFSAGHSANWAIPAPNYSRVWRKGAEKQSWKCAVQWARYPNFSVKQSVVQNDGCHSWHSLADMVEQWPLLCLPKTNIHFLVINSVWLGRGVCVWVCVCARVCGGGSWHSSSGVPQCRVLGSVLSQYFIYLLLKIWAALPG